MPRTISAPPVHLSSERRSPSRSTADATPKRGDEVQRHAGGADGHTGDRPVVGEIGELVRSCCDRRSRSLRWLTYAQVARFPDLIDVVQGHTSVRIAEAMADRLARLTVSGHLRPCDPALAAEQLLALVAGPLETRSRLGTRKVATAEMRALARSAVDTFLRAYAAG